MIDVVPENTFFVAWIGKKCDFCRQRKLKKCWLKVRIAALTLMCQTLTLPLHFWLSSHYQRVCLELIRTYPPLWCDVHVFPSALSSQAAASSRSLSPVSGNKLKTDWILQRVSLTSCQTRVFVFVCFYTCESCCSFKDTSLKLYWRGWKCSLCSSVTVLEMNNMLRVLIHGDTCWCRVQLSLFIWNSSVLFCLGEKKLICNNLFKWKIISVKQVVPWTPVRHVHKTHHHSDLFHALLHSKLSNAKWGEVSSVKRIIMTPNHLRDSKPCGETFGIH